MTSALAPGMNTKSLGLPLTLSLLLAASACNSSIDDGDTTLGPSQGPVATNAAEAWPDAPADVPAITPEGVLEACSIAGACSQEVMQYDTSTRTALIDLCVFDAIFSAERAIPLSGFVASNERPEFWVKCVLDNAQACDLVDSCRTERDTSVVCQEDGCDGPDGAKVSCEGDVATVTTNDRSFVRDCARAFAKCDPESTTGCADRPFTQCPAGSPGIDRCEGNVRLGCDGFNQVSYHDCARLGGSCGEESDGTQGCVYPGDPAPECSGSQIAMAACEGSKLSACVNGRRLEIESPLCAAK